METMDPAANASIERGRTIVLRHGCGDCHGGFDNPHSEAWLVGVLLPIQEFAIPPGPSAPWAGPRGRRASFLWFDCGRSPPFQPPTTTPKRAGNLDSDVRPDVRSGYCV